MNKLTRPEGTATGMGNCGIVATAVVTGYSYDYVWSWIKRKYRKPGNWRGSTRLPEREAFMKAHNVRCYDYTGMNRRRLSTLLKNNPFPGRKLLVRTTRHVQVVMDDLVLDQCTPEAVPIERYDRSKRNKIITSIYVMLDEGEVDPRD